jgi:hypothetical protein
VRNKKERNVATTRELPKGEWQAYFDGLSRHLKAMKVDILVEGLDLGVQVETERALLAGITYDRSDDALEIATDALVHSIPGPRAIYVQEDANRGLLSLKVSDRDGHDQIVGFAPAMALPAHT